MLITYIFKYFTNMKRYCLDLLPEFVLIKGKTWSKNDSNSILWGQPSFLTKLVTSSCMPPSNYILAGMYSRLYYTHHNIECTVKLGVWNFNFSTKYKLFIHCEVFGVGGIDFSLKQFWYLFEENKIQYKLREEGLQKKIIFSLCLTCSTLLSYYWINFCMPDTFRTKTTKFSGADPVEDTPLILKCTSTVTGYPDSVDAYHWYKDGSVIEGHITSRLTLSSLQSPRDNGEYKCTMHNPAGWSSLSDDTGYNLTLWCEYCRI